MGIKTKAEQPEPMREREKVWAQFRERERERERGDDPTRSPSPPRYPLSGAKVPPSSHWLFTAGILFSFPFFIFLLLSVFPILLVPFLFLV